MQFYSLEIAETRVTNENIQAYQWVCNNTPTNSQFIIITGNVEILKDSTLEWFPTFTNRISLLTIQGSEWIKDDKSFLQKIHDAQLLQNCTQSLTPRVCLEEGIRDFKLESYDYIYIARKTFQKKYTDIIMGDSLICDLREENNRYEEVYKSDDVVIFKVIRNN